MDDVCLPKKFNSMFNLHAFCDRSTISSCIFLFFAGLLLFSCFISIFSIGGVSVFVYAAEPDINVSTESELISAVNGAPTDGTSYVIALTSNIDLVESLIITADKNIILASSRAEIFFKLIGAPNKDTIVVENRGVLEIAGITVTHSTVDFCPGAGVHVQVGGILTMSMGEISGNIVYSESVLVKGGGGVYNAGIFEMYGGEISGNEVAGASGGGVYNAGVFEMYGGVISNNSRTSGPGGGGGVYNEGVFEMLGGEISNNTAIFGVGGGGVYNVGVFVMSGGMVSDNISLNFTSYGGGVYNVGVFVMPGGVIVNNTANMGGGVYFYINELVSFADFSMSGGEISNNTAVNGGGLYITVDSTVLNPPCFFITGGKISGNTAHNSGGGVWISYDQLEYLYVSEGVVFEKNQASMPYERDSDDDELYNSHIKGVIWSTLFTQGYNNYDISYVSSVPVRYVVSVVNSFAPLTGAGSYAPKTTVTINAGSREGYIFSRWSVTLGSITLQNVNSATTTFTMPDHNVAITAIWTANDSGGGGGGGGGSSTPKPSTPTPSNPSPSDPEPSTPTPSNTVSPTPGGQETPIAWMLIFAVLIVVVVVLVVVVTVLLRRKDAVKT